MVTLISSYSSSGCVGRCDAKCYAATEPECTCICRGRNHGVGLQQATDQTRELAESWIEHAKQANPALTGFELAPAATHQPLFDMEPPDAANTPARPSRRARTGSHRAGRASPLPRRRLGQVGQRRRR